MIYRYRHLGKAIENAKKLGFKDGAALYPMVTINGEECHITSMAGTWLTIVEGFGGMRVIKDRLHFNPQLPPGWTTISFTIHFRGNLLSIKIEKGGLRIFMYGKEDIEIIIRKTVYHIKPETEIILNH